ARRESLFYALSLHDALPIYGRRGFVGPASHLYRRHPPTGWVRIDGPLRPRAFACADLPTHDLRASDARQSVPIRSEGASGTGAIDRKSTRLNSSHVKISYAV